MQTQLNNIQTAAVGKIFPLIQEIIVHTLTLDPEEITLDTSFEDDLDILDTPVHMKIIAQIKKYFENELPDLHTEELLNCETVAELVSMIEDEQELEQELNREDE